MDLVILAFLFCLITFGILKIVLPPWNFPRNIPTIPFYVTFLATIWDVDQEDIYEIYLREPLEKYGAVKLYFGSRWNIVVSRPELLAQVFKDEDTFAKSGNHKKIPYGVIAAYTGENVISAHGAIWKTFRRAITPGLQIFDHTPMIKNAEIFCSLISKQLTTSDSDNNEKIHLQSNEQPWELQEKKSGIVLMPELIQRLSLANISEVALGFDIETLTKENSELHVKLKNVKSHIFKSLYLNFPLLDKLPIPSRQRARRFVEDFRECLMEAVETNLLQNYTFEQTAFSSSDLIRSFNKEEISKKQLIDNVVIIMVAGHENPQLLLTTCFYMFAKNQKWQKLVREEVQGCAVENLSELPLLNSFIFECVRMYPPLSQIINRCTSKPCRLGRDIILPRDVYVGYNVLATGRQRSAWGKEAHRFIPERWGDNIDEIMKEWKHRKNTCAMSAFHGGRRACLGEKLALMEVRIAMSAALKGFEWSLAPNWADKVTPAGPLCPAGLKVKFTELA
ncbi:putative cytochrome P450 [Lachancea thermotolerans CBS 6340]|uniref:KLTH0G02882p n=1 Tax=Lachancea thermotolerans (strain ATCC 56472 / CBS 6340 / NRRL Y-8284) TaxID=559295 RepID=C5DLR6_LACTC|nr:KLTH0G02882p [Lachancea thermotolerans CBS 6340]CAR24727.1 KLTH0G02882p [Lachancea thermotolerans CBS 6340]